MTARDMAELGARLRALREERGYSLSALAESAGVSKGYLSDLERGTAGNPTVDVVRKIAGGLGVPLLALLGEDGAANYAPPPMQPGLREFLEESARHGEKIPDQAVEILARMARRGRKAQTAADWAYLYQFLKRNVL